MDNSETPNQFNPWFLRGGVYNDYEYAGVFGFTANYGGTGTYNTFRTAIVVGTGL